MAKDVLIEIGLEELPARFIDDAEKQLLSKATKWLEEQRISFDSVTSFSTPRRLAVKISNIAEYQTTIEEEAKGPAEKIAKDENGEWTKAAIGFTKGQGKTPDDIYTKEIKGISYIFVKKHIDGKPVSDLLPEFKGIIESIQFGKNMRWASETLRYARPIRWLVALYGNDAIPFEITGVQTANKTVGHRFLGKEITLNDPSEYESSLAENYVVVNSKEREKLILKGIEALEKENGFKIPVDADLLAEVRNLVEYPTVFMGSFEDKFLHLPAEVLITSMKEHQRYFPVITKDGDLLPHFIGVRNGDDHHLGTVARGNEKVLRARLSDGEFFFEEDKKQSISYYQEKLDRVVFQEKLGTISDKVKRIIAITESITDLLELEESAKKKALRAAEISKFDLMTNMVNEFTELQGVIGEKYAVHFGEDADVAQAIREHYLPKQANGDLPDTLIGAIVSIADKVDTIVGCISVGLIPTGSQDPYGLRRQAAGILRIMENRKWDVSLEEILDAALSVYQQTQIEQHSNEEVQKELNEFFRHRAVFLLKEMDIAQDVIHAVLHAEVGRFDYTISKAKILADKRNDESFKPVQEALTRVLNLSDKAGDTDSITPERFVTDTEKELFEKYRSAKKDFPAYNQVKAADDALSSLAELAEPIHEFFENNMVMTDDIKIRANRLGLIHELSLMIKDFADFRIIEWKQQF
ncbi:glycine--tRNA ligase subunit beta [Oceanobacillus damuensis]|uniref:glycine--tRNA ligase subunit beta n=1 Tax=Oceanobacillus damuensis TaxID=937928 RepID=UPI0008320573|nr:glycine--tRNA ligase subunit beta [Oceanobacillus damuensis]